MNREIYATNGEYNILQISDKDFGNYIELHRRLIGAQTFFDLRWFEHILKR